MVRIYVLRLAGLTACRGEGWKRGCVDLDTHLRFISCNSILVHSSYVDL